MKKKITETPSPTGSSLVGEKKKKKKTDNDLQKWYRSDYFQEVRKMVLDRDHHRCRTCGATEEERVLNCHHSKYDGVLYNEKENLDYMITLCTICHRSIHGARQNWKRFKKNS